MAAVLRTLSYELQTEAGEAVRNLERFCTGRSPRWSANLLATPSR